MMGAMRSAALGGLALAAMLVASQGCVTPDQMARIQKDVADVRQKLNEIAKDQQAQREQLAAIETRLSGEDTVKRSEVADLKLRFEEVTGQTLALEERLQETNRRIDRLSQDVVAAKEMARRATPAPVLATGGENPPGALPLPGSSPTAPTAPAAATVPGREGALPSPEALYNSAYADFSKGNYALAVSGFQEYASRFPESDLADNALYWIGECYFSQGRFEEAVKAFDDLLEKYPEGDRTASADLKKGLAFLEMNKVAQAITQLKHVVETRPGSDEARIAQEKLSSLVR
jgi:tol-pal system protein YbgF